MRSHSSLRRIAGRLCGAAGTAAVVAILVAGAGTMLFLGLGPRTGAYRTLTVLSGSMRPMIEPGDVVVVRPVPTSALRVGDVVTFQAPTPDKATVTHRIIEIVEPGASPVVRTQGDNNNTPDPWTAKLAAGTAWRFTGVVPVVGHAINVLSRPDVRQFVSRGLPLALAVVWIISLIPAWREEGQGDESELPESPLPSSAMSASARPPVRVVVAVAGACLGLLVFGSHGQRLADRVR